MYSLLCNIVSFPVGKAEISRSNRRRYFDINFSTLLRRFFDAKNLLKYRRRFDVEIARWVAPLYPCDQKEIVLNGVRRNLAHSIHKFRM